MMSEAPEHIGAYEVVGFIGKGGMGSVYKALQPSLNRLVAIKILPAQFATDPERVARFEREAQAVALLNHPNIVQIIDKACQDDLLYFVMEYVEGTSLGAVLAKRHLTLSEALHVAKEVARGLECAHRRGVIHRDLKPGNILISEDLSAVKIVDFGISRIEAISRASGTLTTTNTSLGTMYYFAPEQAERASTADHRADIYSLGVICYEMLTGRVPVGKFKLPTELDDQLPPELDRILLKCLATSPDDRYASVTEFLHDVEALEHLTGFQLVNELKGLSRSTTRLFKDSTTRIAKKRRTLVYGGAGTTAALVLLGLGAWLRSPATPAGSETLTAGAVAAPASTVAASENPGAAQGVERTSLPPAGQTPEASQAPQPAAQTPPAQIPPVKPEPSKADATAPAVAIAQPAGASASTKRRATSTPPAAEPAAKQLDTAAARQLEVAHAKFQMSLYDQALADLAEFKAQYGESAVAPDAYLLMAQIQEQQGKIDDARALLIELARRYTGDVRAGKALLTAADLTLRTRGRERDARNLLTEAAGYSDGAVAIPALLARAAIEEKLDLEEREPTLGVTVPAALLSYRDVVQRFERDAATETALWKLADAYDGVKRYEEEVQALERLGTRFPATKYEVWFKAGDLCENKLKDKNRARNAYLQVPQSSRRYSDAQKRVQRLER